MKMQVSHTAKMNSSRQSQQGIALIAVVMILILISLVGAISVRYSNLNQLISKNSQAKKLLKQSADIPLAVLTREKGDEIKSVMNATGPFGALRVAGNERAEYVLCYRPQTQAKVFKNTEKRIIKASPTGGVGTTVGATKYCDITDAKSFTSKRKLVATQLSVTRPNRNSRTEGTDVVMIEPFEASEEGTDNASIDREEPIYYRAYSTSILPSLSAADDDAEINKCLQKPMGGLSAASDGMSHCLEDEVDVPLNTQVQDYIYMAKITK